MTLGKPVLRATDLRVSYPIARTTLDRLRRRPEESIHALDGVSIQIASGEIVGLVGESGCGKSTLARCLVGLLQPDSGELLLDDQRLTTDRSRELRRQVQIVFQDPFASLNPRMTVGGCLNELLVDGHRGRAERRRRSLELLDLVGLPRRMLDSVPGQMSGGQRQRVAIARAIATEPRVLVADEPVSALDVSVQVTVLELIDSLRSELGLAVLFITHNMAVVRHLCDRVAVMYLGRIIETSTTADLFDAPRHPYTQRLIQATPRLHGTRRRTEVLPGNPPSPINLPTGCRFHPRCDRAQSVCTEQDPPLMDGSGAPTSNGHAAACHFPGRPAAPPVPTSPSS